MTTAHDLDRYRADISRLAYRMLGSVGEAEDVLHEAYLRWKSRGEPELRDVKRWLVRTCTRLCLDRIKSAARSREEYIGEWLPEPLVEAHAGVDPSEVDESVSFALLATVQRLGPSERAVFLLHDVFGYEFKEVALILGKSPVSCRQLAVRARQHLAGDRPRPNANPAVLERLTQAFFAASREGDLGGLRALLGEDIVLRSDGGGKVPAARRPIVGPAAVARFFHRVLRGAWTCQNVWFNGAPGVLLHIDGRPASAFQFQATEDRITAIYVQRNPDKLRCFKQDGWTGAPRTSRVTVRQVTET